MECTLVEVTWAGSIAHTRRETEVHTVMHRGDGRARDPARLLSHSMTPGRAPGRAQPYYQQHSGARVEKHV
eukprot:7381115-Prymnesium_polylepis.3